MEMQGFRDKTATIRPSEGQGSAARALGIVETPQEVVTFMVNLALEGMGGALSVLEPACGSCPFLTAFREARGADSFQDRYVGVEVRSEVVKASANALLGFRLVVADFLLWETHERFDIVIGNPPYGIIGEPGHYPISVFREMKRIYRRLFATWCGKYNIYGAFIEKGLTLLKPHGKLVYVVPGTFMFLDDFKLLRKFMSGVGRVSVHYLGSVFPGKNVVAVVLVVEKGKRGLRVMEWNSILYERPEYRGDIIRFEDASTEAFERGKVPLGRVFEIHFAARSPQIKSHPLTSRRPENGTVPVLTGRNLKAGKIDYETCYSGFYFPLKDARLLRPFYGIPHIVVAHTKGARVVAALDEKCYPWREEFHLTPRRIGLDQSAIVSYLNSEPVQQYVKSLYRDVSPHLTKRMLEALPLPRELCKEDGAMEAPLYQSDERTRKFEVREQRKAEKSPCDLLKGYEEFLKSIDLTSYRERFQRVKTVEQDLPRPLNPLPAIYNAYWLTEKQPSFEEFFAYYWDSRPKEIMDFIKQYFWGCSIEFVRQGFEARLYRTWVSLLTQFHLGYLWNCIHPGSFKASAELDMGA